MSYPSLEQYNEALQHPQLALSDPALKQGTVTTTGLGLPLALCGGFALTYTIKSGSKKYAVRCFHKQSNALETRYAAISSRLSALRSQYFLDFEFQPQGVQVAGKRFPIVKMAWATGVTLGEFLEANYRNPGALKQLGLSLRDLTKYLERQGMAHGDIQPGNIMVSDGGKVVQLIDYDGLYVEELRGLGSAELGHRNFQHPLRATTTWDSSLDRFSFIAIDFSLRVIAAYPDLWVKTQSDGDAFLFKANDFSDPSQSSIFSELAGKAQFSEEVKAFAAICSSAFDKTPVVHDFLAGKNIPQISITIAKTAVANAVRYLAAFPVLDARIYSSCLSRVGDKVELIGQIVEVKQSKTRHGKPYIFINFGPWRGQIVKVAIWSEGLAVIKLKPDQSWVGRWLSVVGLMEPPYISRQYKYSHLAISVTQGAQIHPITEGEAKFRLAGSGTRSPDSISINREILDGVRKGAGRKVRASAPVSPRGASAVPHASPNQAVLQQMRANQAPPQSARRTATPLPVPPKVSSNRACFIATEIYGSDAVETERLRHWRDTYLLKTAAGRAFIFFYYRYSPLLTPLIKRFPFVRRFVARILGKFVDGIA